MKIATLLQELALPAVISEGAVASKFAGMARSCRVSPVLMKYPG